MKSKEKSELRDRRILDHIEMVKIIALKISSRLPSHIELDDLIHSGVLGLIDAADKFDEAKGIKFSTYASLRIKGAILDDLRHMDWATRTQRQKIKELDRTTLDLAHRLGRAATEEELATEMNMDVEELYRLLEQSKGMGIGVFRYQEEQEGQLGDERTILFSSDDSAPDPGVEILAEEMKTVLSGLIDLLPEREKMVISLYYQEDLNLKEIGKVMNLTESRISQIRSLALTRIRSALENLARENKTEGKALI